MERCPYQKVRTSRCRYYTVGGSETLEYAIDDYAISRLAASLGEPRLAEKFLGHAMAWRYLFNSATAYLSARGEGRQEQETDTTKRRAIF